MNPEDFYGALYYDTEAGKVGQVVPAGGDNVSWELMNNVNDMWVPPTGAGGGGYGAVAPVDPNAAVRKQLRGDITGRGAELQAIYDAIFGDLDSLLRDKAAKVESEYGDQFKQAASQYAASIPTISNSYASVGAADSTDNADAKTKAKQGFDETNVTIGKNKEKDLSSIGQYGNEQRAKFTADKDSLNRNIARAGETEDVDALRGMRNDIESGIGNASVARAQLGTDAGARGELSRLTADNGRFAAASNALDQIIKSSMSGAVKEAAVKSIVDNAGLSDTDKEKVKLQYGNVYNETNAA